MLGRALLALAAMELRSKLRRAARRAWASLSSRPMGLPEKAQPLTHRDAERIAEASRRAGHEHEEGVKRDP